MDFDGKTTGLDDYEMPTALAAPLAPPVGPLTQFAGVAGLGALGAASLLWVLGAGASISVLVCAFLAYAAATSLSAISLRLSYPHPVIGLCNAVTLFRLASTAVLFGAVLMPSPPGWAVFAIASVTFLLDGVDGWLARRSGLVSDFGAQFDMEVDSLFALVLAVLAYQSGAGLLALLLGLPRYAFGVAQLWLPWLGGPLSPRFSRKVVCVVQIAALVLMLAPSVGPAAAQGLAGLAAAAVVWSFAVDIRALWRSAGCSA